MTEIPASSAKQRAALWVGIVFVLGLALGGVLGYSSAHRRVAAASPPLSEPERRAHRVAELTQVLSLSPQQSQQIDAILKEIHGEIKAVHDQTDAQIEQLKQKGRSQMRAVLTPEQAPKLDEYLKRLDEERKRNGPSSR